MFLLNHLAPPSKGEIMPKAPTVQFLDLEFMLLLLNLITFIIRIEKGASLLALAKSI